MNPDPLSLLDPITRAGIYPRGTPERAPSELDKWIQALSLATMAIPAFAPLLPGPSTTPVSRGMRVSPEVLDLLARRRLEAISGKATRAYTGAPEQQVPRPPGITQRGMKPGSPEAVATAEALEIAARSPARDALRALLEFVFGSKGANLPREVIQEAMSPRTQRIAERASPERISRLGTWEQGNLVHSDDVTRLFDLPFNDVMDAGYVRPSAREGVYYYELTATGAAVANARARSSEPSGAEAQRYGYATAQQRAEQRSGSAPMQRTEGQPWHQVRVTLPSQAPFVYEVRGANEEQAMANARWNWEDARIEYLGPGGSRETPVPRETPPAPSDRNLGGRRVALGASAPPTRREVNRGELLDEHAALAAFGMPSEAAFAAGYVRPSSVDPGLWEVVRLPGEAPGGRGDRVEERESSSVREPSRSQRRSYQLAAERMITDSFRQGGEIHAIEDLLPSAVLRRMGIEDRVMFERALRRASQRSATQNDLDTIMGLLHRFFLQAGQP